MKLQPQEAEMVVAMRCAGGEYREIRGDCGRGVLAQGKSAAKCVTGSGVARWEGRRSRRARGNRVKKVAGHFSRCVSMVDGGIWRFFDARGRPVDDGRGEGQAKRTRFSVMVGALAVLRNAVHSNFQHVVT